MRPRHYEANFFSFSTLPRPLEPTTRKKREVEGERKKSSFENHTRAPSTVRDAGSPLKRGDEKQLEKNQQKNRRNN